MNLKGHTREIVLGLLLVAFLFWLFRPRSVSVEEGGPSEMEKEVTRLSALPGVDLALLTAQPGEYQGGGRNLFDYGVIQPPPPSAEELARLAALAEERRRQREEEERKRREEAERRRLEAEERARALREQRASAPKPAGPAMPKPPVVPFRFMGVIGPTDERIAIFLEGSDFILGQEGEAVKEQFRIVKIGYETLKIGYTDPRFQDQTQILEMGK